MIQPPFLKKGDKVGIIIPAGKIDNIHIDNAISLLEKWGLVVSFVQENTTSDNSFSTSDALRAQAFQNVLDDEEIRAIFCARGGYGTIRIIEELNFDKFINSPKWIIGFSDITTIHSLLNNKYKIQSLHAIMPISYPKDGSNNDSLKSLKNALFGKKLEYSFPSHKMNKPGKLQGTLTGGNLSILYSLRGTDIDIRAENKILFIEEVGEFVYHIDRMLMNFKRGGILKNIKGLIIGGMSELKDERFIINKSVNELILEKVKDFDYPVIFNFDSGHISNNLALFMGAEVKIEVNNTNSKITFI